MRSTTLIGILLTALVAAPALAGAYVGGGTFVVRTQFGTLLDNGGVVCDGTNGDGTGGGCLPFPKFAREGGFVRVHDAQAGREVAFQVCIDNNGDGICGGPQGDDRCRDQIFFSHDDSGRFFNPLGPLPTSRLADCPTSGHDGYVVLLCQGAHEVGGSSHTHSVTRGSIGLSDFGAGYGNFCGGGSSNGTNDGFADAVAKAYVVR